MSHDFADKGVLNILGGVLPKWFLSFYRYDSVALTLDCKLASLYHLLHLEVNAHFYTILHKVTKLLQN